MGDVFTASKISVNTSKVAALRVVGREAVPPPPSALEVYRPQIVGV
jgi:hypothetical protein